MNAKQVEITKTNQKHTLNSRNYKNKPKITYHLIGANFFLLFSLYYCVFLLLFLYQSGRVRHLCFDHRTATNKAGQKTIS